MQQAATGIRAFGSLILMNVFNKGLPIPPSPPASPPFPHPPAHHSSGTESIGLVYISMSIVPASRGDSRADKSNTSQNHEEQRTPIMPYVAALGFMKYCKGAYQSFDMNHRPC